MSVLGATPKNDGPQYRKTPKQPIGTNWKV